MSTVLTGRAVLYRKARAEDCYRIDMAALRKEGLLNELSPANLDRCRLEHKQTGESFRVTSTVPFYGGSRYWVLCPCGRRVRVLYKPVYSSKGYRCRFCHDLTYEERQRHRDSFEPLWKSIDNWQKATRIRPGQKGFNKLQQKRLMKMAAQSRGLQPKIDTLQATLTRRKRRPCED